mmetsp:Transcript_21517/g.69471  ORF Transcript_21517/g.69471 Transcript_21517/m.69471 type:complete len:213 (-) Transcript_21517:68-706(-)
MPLMLLRNLNPREGLCNGTRLIARKLHANNKLLEAQIISGADEHRGRIVLLPRIDMYPEKGRFPFEWCRRQFPVRAAFAMTVNKAQGQTLERVGIFLAAQCFAHGQLYVAASRVGHPDRLRFAVLPDEETGKFLVRNIVYREALTGGGGARAPDLNGRAGTHDDEYDSNPEDASDTETSDDGSSSDSSEGSPEDAAAEALAGLGRGAYARFS